MEVGTSERMVGCYSIVWFLVCIAGLHIALVWCFHLTKTVLPGGKGKR